MSAPPHQWIVCESFLISAVQRAAAKERAATSGDETTTWPLPGSGGALNVRSSGGSEGRTVHAARKVRAFEDVLAARAYVQLVKPAYCRHCVAPVLSSGSDPNAVIVCEDCGFQRFCSAACRDAWMPMHKATKECSVLALLGCVLEPICTPAATNSLKPARRLADELRGPAFKQHECLDFVLLVLVLARAFAERFVVAGDDPTGAEDIVLCGLPDDAFADDDEASGPPRALRKNSNAPNLVDATMVPEELCVTFADIAAMTTNLCAFSSMRLSKSQHFYDLYCRLQQRHTKFLPNVSTEFFLRLFCANQCNAFGLWTPVTDECGGQALVPSGALANHSCCPNVFRPGLFRYNTMHLYALRDIEAGEEIALSYTDPRMKYKERSAALKSSQLFDCRCPRCEVERRNHSFTGYDAASVLCGKCKSRGYFVPTAVAEAERSPAMMTGVVPCAFSPSEPLRCIDCGNLKPG